MDSWTINIARSVALVDPEDRTKAEQALVIMYEELMLLRAELQQYRSRVTVGGPPAPITQRWENAPEDEVVELPKPDTGDLQYGICTDCGQPHPAWISCEAERQVALGLTSEPPE